MIKYRGYDLDRWTSLCLSTKMDAQVEAKVGCGVTILYWKIIDTINEATSFAIIYSIAETDKANNLKLCDYFEYLLTETPKHEEDRSTDFLKALLPWTETLPRSILGNTC